MLPGVAHRWHHYHSPGRSTVPVLTVFPHSHLPSSSTSLVPSKSCTRSGQEFIIDSQLLKWCRLGCRGDWLHSGKSAAPAARHLVRIEHSNKGRPFTTTVPMKMADVSSAQLVQLNTLSSRQQTQRLPRTREARPAQLFTLFGTACRTTRRGCWFFHARKEPLQQIHFGSFTLAFTSS